MAGQNWGQVDNLRYHCCFVCVDASLPVLDGFVEQRVDCMMDAGLLNEVYDIYNLNADYTRGLRQAIGVREFEPFLSLLRNSVAKDICRKETELTEGSSSMKKLMQKGDNSFNENLKDCLNSSCDTESIILLKEGIDKVKINTRRLVRRQVRTFCHVVP